MSEWSHPCDRCGAETREDDKVTIGVFVDTDAMESHYGIVLCPSCGFHMQMLMNNYLDGMRE